MRGLTIILISLGMIGVSAYGQENSTNGLPKAPPAPPPVAPDNDGQPTYRINLNGMEVRRRVEVEGALARIRKRAAWSDAQPAPARPVPTREDTSQLTTDPVTRQYTGFNLFVIKF